MSGYDYAAQQVIAPEHEIGTFLTSQKRSFVKRLEMTILKVSQNSAETFYFDILFSTQVLKYDFIRLR